MAETAFNFPSTAQTLIDHAVNDMNTGNCIKYKGKESTPSIFEMRLFKKLEIFSEDQADATKTQAMIAFLSQNRPFQLANPSTSAIEIKITIAKFLFLILILSNSPEFLKYPKNEPNKKHR